MLQSETAPLEEVAAAIGRDADYLRRHWLRLHERQGFPRKLACGWVWPRRQVEAWLRAGGTMPARLEPANQNGPALDVVAAASAALSQRYGGQA